MRQIFCISLLLLLPGLFLAAEDFTLDENSDGKPDQWISMDGSIMIKVEMDTNYDGKVDSIVEYNAAGQKDLEQYDFNFDGKMDDYYFFENGLLTRREIDSNYDGKIDIWLYLDKGKYVRKLEQDTDFDGVVDLEKVY